MVQPYYPASQVLTYGLPKLDNCVHTHDTAQLLEVSLFVLVLSFDGSSLECGNHVYEESDP